MITVKQTVTVKKDIMQPNVTVDVIAEVIITINVEAPCTASDLVIEPQFSVPVKYTLG